MKRDSQPVGWAGHTARWEHLFHHQSEQSQKAAGRPLEMAHASQGLLWLLSHAVPGLHHMAALPDRCGHEHGSHWRSHPRQASGWPHSSGQTTG